MSNFSQFVKNNRRTIIRRTLVAGVVVTTVIVVSALYKTNQGLLETVEDLSTNEV